MASYDLKNRISSTRNTGQVTRALQIVAASKQKKTQDNLRNSRFLRNGLKNLIEKVANQITTAKAVTEVELPLLFKSNPESNKILIISIMSGRGLCGSLNTKLFYKILQLKKRNETEGKIVDFISVNRMSQKFLKNFNESILAFFGEIPETPEMDQILPLINFVKEKAPEYQKVYLAYSNFVKTGVYDAEVEQLLPISTAAVGTGDVMVSLTKDDATNSTLSHDNISQAKPETLSQYIIEPDPATVLEKLANLFVDLEITEGILSNIASENTARMISMKKATDNIKTIVDDLTLKLNKERQAKITQQVAEIAANL